MKYLAFALKNEMLIYQVLSKFTLRLLAKQIKEYACTSFYTALRTTYTRARDYKMK